VKLGAIEAGLDGWDVGFVVGEVRRLAVEFVDECCSEVVVSILAEICGT